MIRAQQRTQLGATNRYVPPAPSSRPSGSLTARIEGHEHSTRDTTLHSHMQGRGHADTHRQARPNALDVISTPIYHPQHDPTSHQYEFPSSQHYSAIHNLGSGSGLTGSRGQKWMDTKGVLHFLMQNKEQDEKQTTQPDVSSSSTSSYLPSSPTAHQQRWKQQLTYANIRPDTAQARWRKTVYDAKQKKIVSVLNEEEQRKHNRHRHDVEIVKQCVAALGRQLCDYNLSGWFRDGKIKGREELTPEAFRDMLPSLLSCTVHADNSLQPSFLNEPLSNDQLTLLQQVIFEKDKKVTYQTAVPRLKRDKGNVTSDVEQYLQRFSHLPIIKKEPRTLAPRETLLALHERITTNGLQGLFNSMTKLEHSHTQQSDTQLPRGSIRYDDVNQALHRWGLHGDGIAQILDADKKGYVTFQDLLAFHGVPKHQILAKYAQQSQSSPPVTSSSTPSTARPIIVEDNACPSSPPAVPKLTLPIASEQECTQTITQPFTPTYHPMFQLSSPKARPLIDDAHYKSIRSLIAELRATGKSVVPPLFESTMRLGQMSARRAHEGFIEGNEPTALSYSVHHPPKPPTRYGLTPISFHTPASIAGGVGRPISAARQPKQPMQPVRDRQALWMVPAYGDKLHTERLQSSYRAAYGQPPQPSSHTQSARPAAHAAVAAATAIDNTQSANNEPIATPAPVKALPAMNDEKSSSSSSAFYMNESDRFNRAYTALSLQQYDRRAKQDYLANKAYKLERDESRVLNAYASQMEQAQQHHVLSVLDKIQQKRHYYDALLQQSYRHHAACGKRHVIPIEETLHNVMEYPAYQHLNHHSQQDGAQPTQPLSTPAEVAAQA